MPTEAPWEVIRTAADRLEELAAAAPDAPWNLVPTDEFWDITDEERAEWLTGRLHLDPETTPTKPTSCYIRPTGSEDTPSVDIGHSCGCCATGEISPEAGAWIVALSPAVAEPLVTWLRYTAELWEMQDWAEKPDSQTLAAATLEFAGAVLGEVQR